MDRKAVKFNEFNPQMDNWDNYLDRLKFCFEANGILIDSSQRANFFTVCGPQVYETLLALITPKKPSEVTFSEIVTVLTKHYSPKPNEISMSFKFYKRNQKRGESASDYIAQLRKLSSGCNFTALERMLRDRLVCGMCDERLQYELLKRDNLQYQDVVDAMLSSESAGRDVRMMHEAGAGAYSVPPGPSSAAVPTAAAGEPMDLDINAIYKGLDVVTAKATPQERSMAPHHLLDILDPHQMFTVVDFRNRALKLIEDLTGEGKIPIIVGGTNYYIESIVYNILVENMDDGGALLWDKSRRKRDFDKTDIGNESDASQAKQLALDAKTSDDHNKVIEAHTSNELEINKDENVLEIDKNKVKEDYDNEEQFTNEEIHEKLKAIDPAMASRLHPNNRRKVLRSIEVWLKTGRRHSEVLDAQKLSEGKLRRPGATIVFWLKCEESVHSQRLDARVDSMLQDGLVEELLDFHDRHNRHRIQDGKPPDYTKGVFQTLGFKEFHEYLMLSEEQRSTEEGKSLLKQSIENMKLGTRRYARRQNKMVKGRFINHPDREVPPIYELDTTELTKWDAEVKTKAIKIIESFLSGAHCEYDPVKSTKEKDTKAINSQSSNYCDICKRLIIGDKEFAIHLNSNRHQKVLKNKRKFEKKEDPESLEKTDS